ncbi:MAG TPA: MjaI family restriction endonuclease [Bacteroidetes bacterium]|nr:MjaI family restriction endonuclease [Bacteroidota bacterium]
MAYTGGDLNFLNGKYGISAPDNSVPVMKLIKAHRPKTKGELYDLIRKHIAGGCPCGIKSTGSVEDFGKRLYDAQLKEWGTYKYSLQTCIQWEYDLFVTQSLKGNYLEKDALKKLGAIIKTIGLQISAATGYIDEDLRIDLIITKNKHAICGIQVKPHTFKKMRKSVIAKNIFANKKWSHPVLYLFYNENNEWINMDEIVENILSSIDD